MEKKTYTYNSEMATYNDAKNICTEQNGQLADLSDLATKENVMKQLLYTLEHQGGWT